MNEDTLRIGNKIDGIRNGDHPQYKEQIMSQLFGEFIGFLKSEGLTQGKEFETQIKEIFQCSHKIIWIDDLHTDFQITVVFNSIQMSIEFGLVKKDNMEVCHREKIENLRYKISSCTELSLIDPHKEIYDNFFKSFIKHFNTLKPC